jgi:hypothetical protein
MPGGGGGNENRKGLNLMKCWSCLSQADYRCGRCTKCAACCKCDGVITFVHVASKAYAEAMREKTRHEETGRAIKTGG